jgi:YfiH family protein
MPFTQSGELRLYQFDSLLQHNLKHALFTRRGGVSPDPWRSLNLGGTVGDDPERVRHNKQLALAALDCHPESVIDVWQVQSDRVLVAESPRGEQAPFQADAIITDRPELTLLMRFADCVPILLFDPVRSAIGTVHAGWLGTVRKVAAEAVAAMQQAFRTRPADLIACIGPSIGPDHYPVGPEVVEQVRTAFGKEADHHLHPRDGEVCLDLWSANHSLLAGLGVGLIEQSGVCTACHPEDWYSHRGDRGRTGRFGAAISMGG